MKKLTLKKEAVSSLSLRSMARIVGGGGESDQPSNASTAPCRCDLGDTDDSNACITNPMAGCSIDCSVYTCNCGGGGGNLESTQPQYCDLGRTEA